MAEERQGPERANRTRTLIGIIVAISVVTARSQNWYADGKAFALRDNKVDSANLVGPPGIVHQAPPGWPDANALSGNLPAGWKQGAYVVISDSGTPPPQAQGDAKVTVVFQDPSAKTVYATSVDVNLGSPQGDVSQFPIEFHVSAGLNATGTDACTATAQ